LHKTGQPSKLVSQLVFPHVAGPGLLDEDKLQPETCPRCGLTKYAHHKRGYMHFKREALQREVDIVQMYEWFGRGGYGGHREILISHRLSCKPTRSCPIQATRRASTARHWSDHYLNLPFICRPEAGQTIHPVGKGLLVGFMAVAISETYEAGTAALEAGPIGVPVTIVLWVGGTYLLMNWYNIAVTPTGP